MTMTIQTAFYDPEVNAKQEMGLGAGIPVLLYLSIWDPELARRLYDKIVERLGVIGVIGVIVLPRV